MARGWIAIAIMDVQNGRGPASSLLGGDETPPGGRAKNNTKRLK